MAIKRKPTPLVVRETTPHDSKWIQKLLKEQWGGLTVVVHNTVYSPHTCPGFIAESSNEKVSLLTYRINGDSCEIITLNSLKKKKGIGTSLMHAAMTKARGCDCHRIWLVTTNDNISALQFYKNRRLRISDVHKGAVDQARRTKSEIPFIGEKGIAIHDEVEMELILD